MLREALHRALPLVGLAAFIGVVGASAEAAMSPYMVTAEMQTEPATDEQPRTTTITVIDTSGAPAQDDAQPDDAMIAEAVRTELVLARHVPAGHIKVSVDDGIVTLEGEVPALLGKERARHVIGHLRGVRGIVDRLTVASNAVPDAHIRTAVESALERDAATEAYEIDVQVSNGVISLSGTVDSQAEAEIATQVARSVVGARAVVANLEVRRVENRSDEEIQADVARRLHWDARIADNRISVAVNNGVVRLDGTVGSLFERDMVMTRAWVAGAREIDASRLRVEPWARSTRRDSATLPSDTDIAAAVADALSADPRVARYEPRVRVDRGVVTLTGTVDNLKAARAAAEDASDTYGVVAVDNQLEVKPRSPLSDRDLDRYVTIALDRDAFVTDQPIGVSVDDAVVNLNGSVDTYFERSHAEDVAGRMVGVRAVQNELEVAYSSPLVELGFLDWDPVLYRYSVDPTTFEPLPDETIERNIRREMTWSPYIDSEEIEIDVRNGVATLRGRVPSRTALRYAIRSAYRGGALSIDEQLSVVDLRDEAVVSSAPDSGAD